MDVCLSACLQTNSKSSKWISIKCSGSVANGPTTDDSLLLFLVPNPNDGNVCTAAALDHLTRYEEEAQPPGPVVCGGQ